MKLPTVIRLLKKVGAQRRKGGRFSLGIAWLTERVGLPIGTYEMTTQPEIKLPPLPTAQFKPGAYGMTFDGFSAAQMKAYARQCVLADRDARAVQVDKGPWFAGVTEDGRHYVESNDFTHDVRLYRDGDFAKGSDEDIGYMSGIAQMLNAAPTLERGADDE